MNKFVFIALLLSQHLFAQKIKKADRELLNNVKSHITFLADDKLEGRRTGTVGESVAADYLSEQFKKFGLIPKGDSGTFLQYFTFDDGKEINKTTHLIINGNDLKLGKEFFPLSFSANKSLEAAPVMAFQERNMPWFVDVKQVLQENKSNPHFFVNDYLYAKAKEVFDKGGTALILYNSSSLPDDIEFSSKQKSTTADIPVVYITNSAKEKYLQDTTSAVDLKIKIDIADKKRTGKNVIGYIDNGAENTIIIGAHYDHLGRGEDHNSLWTGATAIHNGADDNASGTAAVVELGRMLAKHTFKNYNYLLACFSGEELGLLGSKYFVDHPAISLDKVDYMINLDMIGRLNDSSKTLRLGGYGTSPEWSKLIPADTKTFSLQLDSSGTGPSDHTSFYKKDIPVLFFFTGLHSDYHKPTDDADKINFVGEMEVIKFIYKILERTNKSTKLPFAKTKETMMDAPRFTVTLGIMPDYSFAGVGVRADGIVEGKAAQKAGIKTGDIIISFDDMKTADLNAYMKALGTYKKGDPATVKVLRGNEEMVFNIIF